MNAQMRDIQRGDGSNGSLNGEAQFVPEKGRFDKIGLRSITDGQSP
jgi:hypothetical protein